MTTLTPARVAIVEDDDVLREAMVETLRAIGGLEVIGAASTLAQAFELAASHPRVFLIDLSLPDGSGFELIQQLQTSDPDCLCIVISVFGDVHNVVKAIELGADGYLLKGSNLDQVAAAIHTALEGGAPLSPAVAGHILRKLRADSPRRPPAVTLTERETAVLEGLAKGLSLKELAKVHGLSPHTIGDHVKSIYRKLEVNSRGEAVFEAAQSGLIRFHP